MIKKVINSFLNFFLPQKCIGCEKEKEILCRNCLKRIDYPTLPRAGSTFSAADYNDGIIKKAIWLFKYKGIKSLAEPLAELMSQRIGNKIETKNAVLISIPLSKKRLRERRFNQAELLAKHLSDKLSVMMLTNVLYKSKHTETQVSIKNRKERLNNLKGTFAVENSDLIKGRNIILIDDVSTTGATISEARKTLKDAGAKKIIALVVARG